MVRAFIFHALQEEEKRHKRDGGETRQYWCRNETHKGCWSRARCKPERMEVNRPQETAFLNNKTAKCRLGWGRK